MISINLAPEDLALIAFIVLAIIEALVAKHYYKKSEEYHREIHMMTQSSELKPYAEVKTYDASSNNNEVLNSTENLGTPTYGCGESGVVTIDEKPTTTKIKK